MPVLYLDTSDYPLLHSLRARKPPAPCHLVEMSLGRRHLALSRGGIFDETILPWLNENIIGKWFMKWATIDYDMVNFYFREKNDAVLFKMMIS